MFSRRSWLLWLPAVLSTVALVHGAPQGAMRGGGRGMRGVNPRGPGRPAGEPRPGPKAHAGGPRGKQAARQNMIDHLMSLPPEQQKEFMRTNPRFQRLPPEQQENIQRHLQQFNSLPPERREALRERFELFRQLPPEQQDRARGLYRQWTQHSPERRQELMREFRQLRDASPEDRRQRLESDEFRNRFSDREQETLRGLVDLLPGPE